MVRNDGESGSHVRMSFFPDFSNTDALMAVFVIPVAVQWWNVWYSGSEPGGGGYIVQRMLTARSPGHALGGTLFFNLLNYAIRPWPWYIAAFASLMIFPDLDSIRSAFPGVDSSLIGDDMAYPAMITCIPSGWTGSSLVRHLLVLAANYILRESSADTALKRHGERICARGGKVARRKAKTAVARKLAVTMLAMLKSGKAYEDGLAAESPAAWSAKLVA